ncbi:MAG: helix-turn-helix domain-containing protein [Candidatus Faecivicinus sp.]
MLIRDFLSIGNRLYAIRKRIGMTQLDVAEAAGLAERTYADIERGNVNMRTETLLRICDVLHITPDEILTQPEPDDNPQEAEIFAQLNACSPRERQTALRLLDVYLKSLNCRTDNPEINR